MACSRATRRIAAVALAAAGGAALAAIGWLGPSEPLTPEVARDAAPGVQPAGQRDGTSAVASLDPDAGEPTPEAAPDHAPTPPQAPAATSLSEAETPRFDVVRIEPDGAALVAGRAAPGATVEARLDGETLGEATADASGQFVLFAQTPPGLAPRELTLAARRPGRKATVSADSVLLLPSAPAATETAAAALQPAPEAARSPAPSISLPTVGSAAPPAPGAGGASRVPAPGGVETDSDRAPAALPVLLRTSSTGGVSVLDPSALGPARGVTLDALTYTGQGAVHLAGRGKPGRTARIYADDRAQADARIDPQGAWSATLPRLNEPGRYTLRVDEIDPAGTVASRIETPFLREPPEALAALPDRVVVQPGHSLWAIAQARYGSGTRYALIYGANRERIRDPDLIYPGQVFDLPSGEGPPPR